jgi:DNA mismatch endonuclease (patch repair protein)
VERALRKYLPGGVFRNVPVRSSQNLSAVRGRNNRTTELRLRLALVRARIKGWKLHANGLPGRPDFAFLRRRIVVFVDGCFWHGCPSCGHVPKTNTRFWRAKIQRNIQRDRENNAKLRKGKFCVVRIWEHELKNNLGKCVVRISTLLARNPQGSVGRI